MQINTKEFRFVFLIEFISTFILVFNGALSLVIFKRKQLQSQFDVSIINAMSLFVALSIGGLANPVNALGCYIVGKDNLSKTMIIIVSQFAASICAIFVMMVFFDLIEEEEEEIDIEEINILQACIYEMILSSILVFVSLRVDKPNRIFACSFVIFIANYNGVDISNGAINPARALGSLFISSSIRHIWIYLVFPMIGSLIGSMIFIFINYMEEKQKQPN